jgi:hypothetical protein
MTLCWVLCRQPSLAPVITVLLTHVFMQPSCCYCWHLQEQYRLGLQPVLLLDPFYPVEHHRLTSQEMMCHLPESSSDWETKFTMFSAASCRPPCSVACTYLPVWDVTTAVSGRPGVHSAVGCLCSSGEHGNAAWLGATMAQQQGA